MSDYQVPKPPNKGDRITAADMRKVISLLISRIAVGEGMEIRNFGGRLVLSLSREPLRSRMESQQFILVSEEADYLVCHLYNQEVEGTVPFNVAKDWFLRRTPFDGNTRNSISYVYTGNSVRTSSTDGESDITERVTPSWQAGDVVHAFRGSRGGFGVEDCEWMMYPSNRHWAKSDE